MKTFTITVSGNTPAEINEALREASTLIRMGSRAGCGGVGQATISFNSTGEYFHGVEDDGEAEFIPTEDLAIDLPDGGKFL